MKGKIKSSLLFDFIYQYIKVVKKGHNTPKVNKKIYSSARKITFPFMFLFLFHKGIGEF